MIDLSTANKIESIIVILAREIAKDIMPLEQILKSHNLSVIDYENLQKTPYFQSVLAQASADWNSASNTTARVRLKAAAIAEEALLEMSNRLHDPDEALNHKVELLKVITKLGNLEVQRDTNNGAERFSLVINIGDNAPKTINATVTSGVSQITSEWGDPETYEDVNAD